MSVTAARTESTSTQAAATAASERLSPHERLEMLCDAGTFEPIRSGVVSPKLGARARAGDGVVGGLGRVDGRPVACYAQDVSFLGGSLGAAHADTINRVLQLAGRSRVPVVGFIESGGARMQEGTAALGGYGRIFRHNVALSGVVPQISIIGGLSAGGGCYSPALTDFVVMTQDAAMFLTGPGVVKDVMGEDVSAAELGGHKVHDRNGVCDLVVEDDRAAAALSRSLLSYLPQHSGAGLPRTLAVEPQLADPGAAVPDDPRKVYDVRDAIAGIVDGGSLLEIQPRWARSIVTGLRAHRRAPGRRDRQPAALPRRRARRRVLAEGREIRRDVRRLRDPFGGARRHARLHARHAPGAGRRDPLRRDARARVRGGDGAARDGRAAQGLRRRLHHDELEGPRRRHGVRVAQRGAGRDGRAAGGRDHPPPRAGRR